PLLHLGQQHRHRAGREAEAVAELAGGERMVLEIEDRPHAAHVALEAPVLDQRADGVCDAKDGRIDGHFLSSLSSSGRATWYSRVVTRIAPPSNFGSFAAAECSWRRRLMISTISRCESPPDGRITTLASRPPLSSRALTVTMPSTSTVIASSTRTEPAGPGGRSSS